MSLTKGRQMKRLEIIHLRSSGEPLDGLVRRIRSSMRQPDQGSPTVRLFRRPELESDLAIHVQSDASHRTAAHEVALQLASELRAYGLVEHTRWEELP